MSADSAWALQQAIHAALAASAPVQALVGNPARIYDRPPPDAVFPFVSIGEAEVRDWSNKSAAGAEAMLALHAWSRHGGRKEAKQILDALHGVLHQAPLALTGHVLVDLVFAGSVTAIESDGLTWRGTARFRALTQPA